ncbi:hypothetical protein A3Q56_03550 [Intoshia linei]|uniref:Uncharacterized protein n=1 Tax=Intoshia linei TaxID=1819745 RepID=A0A177B4Q5_9BILA|nr:hypothetical protein A3Q56_03550 [Intoshia linei]
MDLSNKIAKKMENSCLNESRQILNKIKNIISPLKKPKIDSKKRSYNYDDNELITDDSSDRPHSPDDKRKSLSNFYIMAVIFNALSLKTRFLYNTCRFTG